MPPARGRKTRSVTKKKTTTARKSATTRKKLLRVVKQDKVIEAVQYIPLEYAVTEKPSETKLPGYQAYGSRTPEGSSQNQNLRLAHIYRVSDDVLMVQFNCGDHGFLSISKLKEIVEKVATLDVTKEPRSRRSR